MSLEPFRPKDLRDIIGQQEVAETLIKLVYGTKTGGFFPHLLMVGPPGVGKTTAAYAVARTLLGEDYQENFRELNASSDRGINIVREDLDPWTGQMPSNGAPFRILFLDESDQMTPDAQGALRRVIERGESNCRFILAANRGQKIIPAIQSRCCPLNFKPLGDEDMVTILITAAAKAGLPPDQARIKSAISHSRGDARRALNLFLSGTNEGDRYIRLDKAIEQLLHGQGTGGIRVESFIASLRAEGFTEMDEVIESIMDSVWKDEKLDPESKSTWIEGLGLTAFRAASVQSPMLQLRSYLHGAAR